MENEVIKISELPESIDYGNLHTIGTHDDGQGNVTSKKVPLAVLGKAGTAVQGVKVNGTEFSKDAQNKVNLTLNKTTVGLGNVDNTSDADKPVSTAQAVVIASEAEARQRADTELDNTKVDKVTGKGLSTNDYTDTEKTKLAGLENYDDSAVKGRLDAIEGKEAGWDAKYNKPSSGIPASDLASGVIPDVSQFITKSVNDLVNYYLKSDTYTKAEVQSIIDAVKQFTYEVVATLPTASASTMHKIYLVPSSNPKLKNVKDEFITIDNGESADTRYTWEQIGTTTIDLSNYHTIAQETAAINAAIAPFKTEAQIQSIVTDMLASYRTSAAQDLIDALFAKKDGYYAGLSAGYADKAGDLDIQTSAMVRHEQTKAMETTGGDKDVKDGAGFIRVVKGTENGIAAAGAKIISLGFNLIPSGNGTSFTFRCVKGEWGAYGTSAKNNGYLFTDSQGNILVPASVKQNGVAVPTHTDHGNTYYLPPQDGQCTVVFAASQTNPCAHLCWSNGRDTKDNYEAYNASQVDLSSAITAIGGTLRRVGYVFDEINLETKQSIRRIGYRLLNALSWTMEAGPTPEEGEATNTFRAIVSGGVAAADTIKAGGAFAIKGLSGLTFNLDGTSLVCDSTIASVADFVTALGSGTVEYELAVEVVASNSLNGQITISDYGIIIFENTAGASVVDIDFDFDTKWRDFIKNLPNDLEQMNEATGSINNNVEAIAEDVRGTRDVATLPLLCGQPPVLFGAGEPAEAVVPDNWKQFDPATGEGYNWNGNPSAIGQRYINVSSANGGYTAGRKSLDKASADYYVLKWYKD